MISVIIPTYNTALLIERTLRSVLAQSCQDLEILVVDDCSTDTTLDVVRSIGDARIRILRQPENRGPAAAAIALAKEANGILASNNLRDVLGYVELFSLRHVTTGDLLKEALDRQLITIVQGEQLWQKMLQKRRKLGYGSFADFLNARR